MVDRTRYAILAAVLLGAGVAFSGMSTAAVLEPTTAAALALGGALLSASLYGFYQHWRETDEYDERGMAIRYRSGYVSFWALFWFLFVFALGGVGGQEIPVTPEEFVLVAWGFATIVGVSTRTWYKRQF